ASDARARGDLAGVEWSVDVAAGGRHSGPQSAQYPPAAVALRAPRLRGTVRRSAGEALTAPRPGGRGGAEPAALSRALSGLQWSPLLPDHAAGARRQPELYVRQAAAPACGPAPHTPGARAASAPAGAPRPCFGELMHLDGSRHAWLALVPDLCPTLLTV